MAVRTIVLAAAAASLCVAASTSEPLGVIYGILVDEGNVNQCSLIQINLADGVNTTIADVSQVCANISSTWPSYAAPMTDADDDGTYDYLVVLTTNSFARINVATGLVERMPMPAFAANETVLGMIYLEGPLDGLYIITDTTLWVPGGGGFSPGVTNLPFPSSGSITGSPNACELYVSDASGPDVWTISLLGGNVTKVATNVSGPMDMQFSVSSNKIIELAHYQLYAVDPATGNTTHIAAVPNGPGFPSVNTISPSGQTFVFFDFANIHIMDTATGATSIVGNFTGAPRVLGFPQWFDAPSA